ncbi:MAG: hypothetical protein IH786_06000 [Proteobacteria bacterium]|nr:hypothetical protein [Pseudomonadota bacterium]
MRPGTAAAGHMKIHTIGHATRAQGEPIALLTEAGVERPIDVPDSREKKRQAPRSR